MDRVTGYIETLMDNVWPVIDRLQEFAAKPGVELFYNRIIIWLIIASGFLAVGIMVKFTWEWDWLGWSTVILFITMFPFLYGYAYLASTSPGYGGLLGRYLVRTCVFLAIINFDLALLHSIPDSLDKRRLRVQK